MNGLWKKRLTASFLALVMMMSLVPAALAADCADGQHQWDAGTVTKEPTCSQSGEKLFKCTVNNCSATKTEPINTIDHNYVADPDQSKPATCQAAGQTVYICSVCKDTKTTPIDKAEHQWSSWKEDVPATCSQTGREIRTCNICQAPDSREIKKTDHTYVDSSITVTKPATCTETGIRTYTCSVCGAVGKTETIEKIAHKDDNQDGKCDVCKTILSHTHVRGTLQKDANNHWYLCTICNEKMDVTPHADANKDGKCDICSLAVTHTHAYATAWSTNATHHWHACTAVTGCTAQNSLAKHTDAKNNSTNANGADGLCDVCGYNLGTTKYTVTFQTLGVNGTASVTTQSVVSGGYLSTLPSTPAITIGKVTYTFNRWTTYTSNSPWYLYNNQQAVAPSGKPVTGNITYYAIYTSNTAQSTDITLTAAVGKSVNFDTTKFRDAYQTRYSDTPSYVVFSVNSSKYNSFYGKVYTGSTELSASEFSSNSGFNYSGGSSSRRLGNLYFQADKNARNGDTLEIGYTVYGSNYSNNVSGTLTLKVGTGTAQGDINYDVAPGKSVDLNPNDFRKVLRDEYSSATVDYVVFDKPGSSVFDDGTLYYDRGGRDEIKLTRNSLASYDFYYSPSGSRYDLNDLTFVADSSFKSEISLKFTVYGTRSNEYVSGTVVISSTASGSSKGDINYEVAPGRSVDLKANDYRTFLRNEYNNSSAVDYVQFKRPSSSSVFSNGTLYYDRSGSGEVALTRTNLNSYKFYYTPGSRDYDLSDLTFVAGSNFKDEITLEFTVYGTRSNEYVDGTLVIKSTSSGGKLDTGDINYKVTPGKTVELKATDFRTFLRNEYDSRSDVDYVVFRRPGSTSVFNNGTLYYNRGTGSEVTLTRSNLSSYKFYYTPGKNDYDLSRLTFAADSSFKDSITLEFTVYGTGSNEYVDGELVIYTDTTAAAASGYVGSIRYTTTAGTNVQINANDIARFLKQSLPGYSLQYVTLNGVPSTGALYYNYYGASKYGTTSRAQITSSNYAGQSFYFAPNSTAQYALSELTYVPSSYNYCASIPFTAYASGTLSVSGTILISVSQKTLSEVYGVTPRNTAVSFPASSIYNAVLNATGSALHSIQLLKLPASTAGTVYVGSGTGTKAATNVQYTYASGTNSISQLRFVPTASFTGSVEIPYVALNSNGTALASGVFSLGVVNAVKKFTDVTNSTWCYKYVAELSDANVISGYQNGSFKPDSTVSYGAALKLIMLAAGYPEQAPTGSNVFSGYLAKARADGLISRSNVNLSAPITRLQVAQLAAGALKLSTTNLSSVKPFTDTSDLYVQALNAAGIVEGYFSNGTSTFRPNNSLTRGQMSAIVWRMQNYRK